MGTRDITQCINHTHKGSCNRECTRRGFAKHIQADCEHQDESPHKLTCELGEHLDLCIFISEVSWPDHLEEASGESRTSELEASVREAPTKAQISTGDIDAEGHCRIETTSRNRARTVCTCDNDKANGETIILIRRRVFRYRD